MVFPVGHPQFCDTESQWIEFHTSGATFAPRIAVGSGATVSWIADNGARSSSITPTFTFGSPGAHVTRLAVAPRRQLSTINVGFDGGDEGRTMPSTPHVAPQNVTAIHNLQAARGLEILTVSNNQELLALNASGLPRLQFIEAFGASGLASVHVTGCASILRLCFEGASSLTSLSGLSDCTLIRDLRARSAHVVALEWGSNPLSHLDHLCVGSNTFLANIGISGKTLSSLLELWIYESYNLGGTLAVNAPILTDLRAANCAFTDVSLTCPALNLVNLNSNSLTRDGCDHALVALATAAVSGGAVYLTDNPHGPSTVTGGPAITTLQGRGWTVATEALE
jgi:hypothetical protein